MKEKKEGTKKRQKRKGGWRMANGEVGKKELTFEFLFKIELRCKRFRVHHFETGEPT